MSLTHPALEWAAFQDNIYALGHDDYGISQGQVIAMVRVFHGFLNNEKLRHGVMDLLFNPVAYRCSGYWVYSTKNLTSRMASLFLDTVLSKGGYLVSDYGRGLLHYMEGLAGIRNKLKGQLAGDRIEIQQEGIFPV